MPVDMSDGHPDRRLVGRAEPPAARVQPSDEEHRTRSLRRARRTRRLLRSPPSRSMPTFASYSWYRNQKPRKNHAETRTREDPDQPEDPGARVEDEVGAEHGGDRAARAEVRAPARRPSCPASSVIAACASGRDEPARRDRRRGSARGRTRPRRSSRRRPRKSMFPRMWPQLPCMNIAVSQLISHGSGPWHDPLRCTVERRVRDRRVEVRELVEEPDREVRHDDRDVHDREAARRESRLRGEAWSTVAEAATRADIGDLAEHAARMPARRVTCGLSARCRRSRRFARIARRRDRVRQSTTRRFQPMSTMLEEATAGRRSQLTKLRWAIGLNGALSLAFGVVIIIWPGISLYSLVIVFGAYALARGIVGLVMAISNSDMEGRGWLVALEPRRHRRRRDRLLRHRHVRAGSALCDRGLRDRARDPQRSAARSCSRSTGGDSALSASPACSRSPSAS